MLFSLAATVAVVKAIPYQIGHGYDLAELSMWGFGSGTTPRTVLTMAGPDIPATCYNKNSQCAVAFTKEVKEFANLHSIFDYFKSSASIGIHGGYDGVTASIKAAFGQMSSNSWFHDSAGAIGTLMNRRACHAMQDSCLAGSTETLSPDFLNSLHKMKADPTGENTEIMQQWADQVIRFHGTHLCTGTDNGAAIKYISYADGSGKGVANCASSKICLGLSYKDYVGINGCFGQQGCEKGDEKDITFGSNCAAIGGSGNNAEVCDMKQKDQIAFLDSGNLTSTDSVISMKFMRLDTLLGRFGMNETLVKTMGKAIDHHLCMSQDPTGEVWGWEKEWAWERMGYTEPKCVCKRKCENGGTLDPTTCTCKCRGDVMHGWMGPTCTEIYGYCQPGYGTGNKAAATHCATDNWCSNAFHKEYCGATGVCCLTDFKAQCCAFGDVCNCNAHKCYCESTGPKASVKEIFERMMKN